MKSQIFAVDGRTRLAQAIANQFNTMFDDSLTVGKIKIDKFSDGEMEPAFEESIRGEKVYLLCSTNTPDNVVALNLAIDAAKRASAQEIIAVVPYYGYARQDRKSHLRGAIGARVMANMLIANGLDRIIVVDLHAAQIQGMFSIPVDHIEGHTIFTKYLRKIIASGEVKFPLLCSPDAGGMKRVEDFIKKLGVPAVSIYKHRDKPNQVATMELMGDVIGKDVIIIDDMIDTGGTLKKAAELIMERGARTVRAVASHAVLSNNGILKLAASPLTEVILSDTLPTAEEFDVQDEMDIETARHMADGAYVPASDLKITNLSCARIIAKVINAINNGVSAAELQEEAEVADKNVN